MSTTLILSRHTAHENDIPTKNGIFLLKNKINDELKELIQQEIPPENIVVLSSKKNRAKITAETIANEIGGTQKETKIVEYLDYEIPKETKDKKLQEVAKQFSLLNDAYKESYNTNNNFLKDFRENKISGVNFNMVADYYLSKLLQAISIMERREKFSKENPKIIIAGTHCGYIIETILFAIFGKDESFEKQRGGFIDLGDNVKIDIDIEESQIVFRYRNIEKSIKIDDLKKKIKILRKES